MLPAQASQQNQKLDPSATRIWDSPAMQRVQAKHGALHTGQHA